MIKRLSLFTILVVGSGLLLACSEDQPLTTEELVELIRPSTVLVKSYQDGEVTGSGSGWVVDGEDGVIATNFHVIAPGREFKIAIDREGRKRNATLVAAAPCDDIAVLRVKNSSGLQSLPVANQGALRTGEEVISLGFPQNVSSSDQLQVTEGIISVKQTNLKAGKSPVRGWADHPNLVQLDAALNPGNSGGPTVDRDGALVGMNTFVGPPGQGYAIGSRRLKTLLPSLSQGESQDWAGFGFVFNANQDLQVTSVFPNTAAEEEELAPGDVIWSINGETLYNMEDYCRAVSRAGTRPVKASVVYDESLMSLYSDDGMYFPELTFNQDSSP